MKRYIFSIFTRLFIAGSSFLVFLVSASLFGASGRGIISYGTSLFAFFGLIFCFNLGRSFLTETTRDDSLKKELLSDYINFNLITIVLSCMAAFTFWYLSGSAREILNIKIMISLVISSVFYVWSINSSSIFAAFQETYTQEKYYIYTRTVLCIVLGIFYGAKIFKIAYFVGLYSITLGCGALLEIVFLCRKFNIKLKPLTIKRFTQIAQMSFWPHIDYLAFNLYPLILILISGNFLTKVEIGKISLAMQFINVVFVLATVANVRISSYVAAVGFEAKKDKIKKIFIVTMFFSYLAGFGMYWSLKFITEIQHFSSFEGTSDIFLLTLWAIPGFVLYQLVNPIWLQIGFIKKSAYINSVSLITVSTLTYLILPKLPFKNAMIFFSIFYMAIMFNQLILLKKAKVFH